MTTKELLANMLKENVGAHFLDSGGHPQYDSNGNYIGSTNGYGRSFERNRGRDFDKEPSSAVRFSVRDGKLGIEVEHNLYHWLESRIELDEKLDAIFHGVFRTEKDPEDDKSWFELMEMFPNWLAENVTRAGIVRGEYPAEPIKPEMPFVKNRKDRKLANAKFARKMDAYRSELAKYEIEIEERADDEFANVGGIYGEGDPITVNTYNNESLLSQDIQYVYFTWGSRGDREEYAILQVHGGADIRGGYTKPHVFKCDASGNELSIFDNAKATIYCTGKDHLPGALAIKERQEKQTILPGIFVESIDFDSCDAHWYTNDGYNFSSDEFNNPNLGDMEAFELEEDSSDWKPGVICVKDHVGYCPKCGAMLAASDWV